MPDLILSDIHGNWEALEAVIEDAGNRYDRVLCLGDLVGYGADPNAVVNWVREKTGAMAVGSLAVANMAVGNVVRGNHDRACVGLDGLDHFNPSAQASARWTRFELSPENLNYLERLPAGPLSVADAGAARFDLVHGSPLDEDDYLVTSSDVALMRESLDAKLTFFGHTHLQGGFLLARGGVGRIAPRAALDLEPDHFYLVNPGSVGQPRDGDPRAGYVLSWPAEGHIEFHRVRYNVAKAAAKIRSAGLPDSLAQRLHEGC